ncbi:hypothetical protein [Pseudonocardia xinjiangensis]|uniref:Uncharacterized protein n=1 Tax=Pseudonocardia xinjiangensis TaxID=75289 RepID=A0ABX1RJE3_9PSEU|nr:hypothetical protein [Pseudonocardia xinjiangensis]NMH80521.1 hypothetical protein [Pseudonocardia xinjiangensis]
MPDYVVDQRQLIAVAGGGEVRGDLVERGQLAGPLGALFEQGPDTQRCHRLAGSAFGRAQLLGQPSLVGRELGL